MSQNDPFSDLPIEQRLAATNVVRNSWDAPSVTADDLFAPRKRFYETKHVYTHLMTRQERNDFARLVFEKGVQRKLSKRFEKELKPTIAAVITINDFVEALRHQRMTGSAGTNSTARPLFETIEEDLEMVTLFMITCLSSLGLGALCVRKTSDTHACFINKRDIRILSSQVNAWYNCINNSFYCKRKVSTGLFKEDSVLPDLINPFSGFIDIRQVIYDSYNSNKGFNQISEYIQTLIPISEWGDLRRE